MPESAAHRRAFDCVFASEVRTVPRRQFNRYLRSLLIHGARTVVSHSEHKTDPLSRWIQRLLARRGKRKTYVALANKLTRAAWRILQGQTYEPRKMAAAG